MVCVACVDQCCIEIGLWIDDVLREGLDATKAQSKDCVQGFFLWQARRRPSSQRVMEAVLRPATS